MIFKGNHWMLAVNKCVVVSMTTWSFNECHIAELAGPNDLTTVLTIVLSVSGQ